ncbi:MAG: hypothetical protein AB7O37_03740 [Vicinamibacteria bacterium]
MGSRASAAGLAVALALATAFAARPPERVRLGVGGLASPYLGDGWSESLRTDIEQDVAALDPPAATLETRFRFRSAASGASLRLPLASRDGAWRLSLKAMARVRTAVSLHADGSPVGRLVLSRGPWAEHALELAAAPGEALALDLALQAQPLVRVPDEYAERPVVWLSSLELAAPGGLAFTSDARALLAVAPLAAFAFALLIGAGQRLALAAALAASLAAVGFAREAPLALLVALTRLGPVALGAGLLTRAACARLTQPARTGLAALVAAGTLLHGSLAFVPGYDPGDLEIHVRRARDLGVMPFEYDPLLRYGSHLPTPTQSFGEATAALGSRTPIPYSPLPYVFYYAAHALGADLYWAMPLVNTVLAMALAPWLFVVASRAFSAGAAWLAVLLYALDVSVWHHIARSHAPAAFGMALAPAALLLLADRAERLEAPRRALACGCALGLAVLGYSTLVVLVGFFGLALLALLWLDAAGLSRTAKQGLALALAAGGLLAGGLYYFHYLPGLLQGAGSVGSGADLFEGRTFLIFHNESRQSLRVWLGGFLATLVAGLVAAPFAISRARPGARPVLLAWLSAWALTMLAKEPWLFPRPLRWAKEDQFVAPLLALLIGAGVFALPRPWLRRAVAAALLAVALWFQLGDFRAHATALWP